LLLFGPITGLFGLVPVPIIFFGLIPVPVLFFGLVTTPLIFFGPIPVYLLTTPFGLVTTPLFVFGLVTVLRFWSYYDPLFLVLLRAPVISQSFKNWLIVFSKSVGYVVMMFIPLELVIDSYSQNLFTLRFIHSHLLQLEKLD
jgi:hypothetical protein